MFSQRLKELRTQKGYSMDKLVELYNLKYDAKMNKSTLSRYENGLQEPIYTVVVNLADFFNVTIDYLSGGQNEDIDFQLLRNKKNDTITDIILKLRSDSELLNMVKDICELSPDKRSAVQNLIFAFNNNK